MSVGSANIEEIFSQALAKATPSEQAAYLDQACCDDAQLRQRVESLLASHRATANFLNLPDAGGTLEPMSLSESPGTKIDRYKLLEQIGEGGFGVVFMAEQEHPVRRKVALKIIKLGMDTKQVVARFEAERQALAIMDHPNIAKVLDGGATASGRPYFVMELVKGTPITEYCDKHNLKITQRLELFMQVCQAVHHAHQKGLIHRDLKPSNILVSTQDDRPTPKVIDFGIAKATQTPLTQKTLFTEFRQLIGTPEYMSPEQTDGSLDVDTRSDVYSLGVLLYEILTGSAPFNAKELRSKAFEEMKRFIREVDPPPPSTRLSTLENTASIAACRGIEPKSLTALVRGELDWIVMKALEKDRSRRYESAAALAGDVMHYLADEPVAASPPSTRYKLRKLARRNRVALRVTTAFVLLLIVGAIVSFVLAVRATRAKAEALAQERRADKQAAIAEGISQFLSEEVFGLADPRHFNRAGITLVEALDIAADKIDQRFPNDPELRAIIRDRFGEIYNGIDKPQKAIKQLQKAVELRQSLFGNRDARTMTSRSNLGYSLYMANRWTESRQMLESTLADQTAILGAGNPDAVYTACRLSVVLMELRRAGSDKSIHDDEDLQVVQNAYQHALAALGPRHEATLEIENSLSWVLRWHGKLDEALQHARSAASGLQQTRGSNDVETLFATYNYGTTLHELGRLDEAQAVLEPVLKSRYRVLGITHLDSMTTAWRLALVLLKMNKQPEAKAVLDDVYGHLDEIGKEMSVRRGHELYYLANAYIQLRCYERAAALLSVACKMYDAAADEEIQQHFVWLNEMAQRLAGSPQGQLRQGKQAVQLATKACQLTEYKVPDFIMTLGVANMEIGDSAAGQECFEKVLALQPGNASACYYLTLIRLSGGDLAGYRAQSAAMVRQFADSLDESDLHVLLGACYIGPAALDDFSAPLKRSRDLVAQQPGNGQYLGELGRLLYRAGEFDEADKWLAQSSQAVDKAPDLGMSRSLPRFFRAMTIWKLGRRPEALALFAEADAMLVDDVKAASNWQHRLVFSIIRQEARSLLQIEHSGQAKTQ